MRCRRPGCGGAVLAWLDPDYCSDECRIEALHPGISGDGRGLVWQAEQLLPCKLANRHCRYTCELEAVG